MYQSDCSLIPPCVRVCVGRHRRKARAHATCEEKCGTTPHCKGPPTCRTERSPTTADDAHAAPHTSAPAHASHAPQCRPHSREERPSGDWGQGCGSASTLPAAPATPTPAHSNQAAPTCFSVTLPELLQTNGVSYLECRWLQQVEVEEAPNQCHHVVVQLVPLAMPKVAPVGNLRDCLLRLHHTVRVPARNKITLSHSLLSTTVH